MDSLKKKYTLTKVGIMSLIATFTEGYLEKTVYPDNVKMNAKEIDDLANYVSENFDDMVEFTLQTIKNDNDA